jgi:hypothetical protein
MRHNLNDATQTPANERQCQGLQVETTPYASPALYVIGRSNDLLQGSGRHKNDDTGSRGFTVDQH